MDVKFKIKSNEPLTDKQHKLLEFYVDYRKLETTELRKYGEVDESK